jgi:hypothetical protein
MDSLRNMVEPIQAMQIRPVLAQIITLGESMRLRTRHTLLTPLCSNLPRSVPIGIDFRAIDPVSFVGGIIGMFRT